MSKLQSLLYILLRDDIVAGRIEQIMRDHVEKAARDDEVRFCNPYLAAYAAELAQRILNAEQRPLDC